MAFNSYCFFFCYSLKMNLEDLQEKEVLYGLTKMFDLM